MDCVLAGAEWARAGPLTSPPTQSGTVIYFECEDLDERYRSLRDKGLEFESPPTHQRWLWREAHLRDPDGNRLCLFRAGENRRFPPWRTEKKAKNAS